MTRMNWNRVHRDDLAARARPYTGPMELPPPVQCAAIKRDGSRCQSRPKRGDIFCGPHCDHPPDKIARDERTRP